MFERILVAYDGSKQADQAFAHALEIAARFRAELLVLSIARPPEPAVEAEVCAAIDSATAHFEEAFAALATRAGTRGVTLRTDIAVGHPAEQIVIAAEREKVQLIIIGRRGKTMFKRWMLGSISERVLRYAHCAVLVVH
jgi:nucleotide-binding universal stress UspA family protein